MMICGIVIFTRKVWKLFRFEIFYGVESEQQMSLFNFPELLLIQSIASDKTQVSAVVDDFPS